TLCAIILTTFSLLKAQNNCLEFGELFVVETSLGSPLEGPFAPNEEITIELQIAWNAIDCNWLHGIVPTFGNGWVELYSEWGFEPEITSPISFQGPSGNLFWYLPGELIYKLPDSQEYEEYEDLPAGWFVTGTSPGPFGASCYQYDPYCSCGITQNCGFAIHTMRFKVMTRSIEDCMAGFDDLSVTIKLFSDIETGSGISPACIDIPAFSRS
ncbi:MAG: hypothetical protein AAGJ93_11645, partial [Bacteroidota bacterium]